MLVAMLIPALLLTLGSLGWVEEYTAYFLALGSGILLLGVIGYVECCREWKLVAVADRRRARDDPARGARHRTQHPHALTSGGAGRSKGDSLAW